MTITPNHYLFLSIVLFNLGLVIVAARRQALLKLLGLQMMFQAINLALVSLTEWFQAWEGQVAVLLAMTLSVAEFVLGFGLAWGHRESVQKKEQVEP